MSIDELPGEWETIIEDATSITRRLRVPGGWLVEVQNCSYGETHVQFIVDQNWDWKIGST